MKRPLALRHLRRMHEMVTSASICQVVGDRALLQSPILERGAANFIPTDVTLVLDANFRRHVVAFARSEPLFRSSFARAYAKVVR